LFFYVLQGATLALSATIMPGPFQTFLISRALRNGWLRTLPAAFAPLVTDGPIIALVLFVLTQTPPWFLEALRIAGGLFILYLSRGILLSLRSTREVPVPDADAARRSFLEAVVINALNPNPYIFWSVVAGPIVLSGWREAPHLGIGFLAGFYGTFVCSLSLFIITFATAGRLDPRVNLTLRIISGLALAAFGIYQMAAGLGSVMQQVL
jgi:threonine/homoserine/homoserine lactone efflux protein